MPSVSLALNVVYKADFPPLFELTQSHDFLYAGGEFRRLARDRRAP
jgi:hypothetical protein